MSATTCARNGWRSDLPKPRRRCRSCRRSSQGDRRFCVGAMACWRGTGFCGEFYIGFNAWPLREVVMTAPRRAARAPPSSQCRSAALNQTGLAATPGDQVIRWRAAPVSPSTARPMPSRSPSRRRAADVMSGAPFAAISIDGAAVSAVLPLATAGEDFTLKGLGAFPAGSPAFGSGDQCRCRRLGAAVPVRLSGPEGLRGAPILTDPRAASPASPLALPAMSIDAPAALHHRRRCLWRCKKARRIAPAGLSRHVMRTSARERVTTARRG